MWFKRKKTKYSLRWLAFGAVAVSALGIGLGLTRPKQQATLSSNVTNNLSGLTAERRVHQDAVRIETASTKYVSARAAKAYLSYANNTNKITITNWSGIAGGELVLNTNDKIIDVISYDKNGNNFIGITLENASSYKFVVYNSNNITKVYQEYTLTEKYTKAVYINGFVYFFKTETASTGAAGDFALLNTNVPNSTVEKKALDTTKLKDKLITNLTPVVSGDGLEIYLLTWLDKPTDTLSQTSSFSKLSYAFVDQDLKFKEGFNSGSGKDIAFEHNFNSSRNFKDLNWDNFFRFVPSSQLALSNFVAAISLTDAVLLINLQNNFAATIINTPSRDPIQSIIFKDTTAYVLMQEASKNQIYRLAYNSGQFFQTQDFQAITGAAKTDSDSNYGLVNVLDDAGAYILTNGTRKFGISSTDVVSLNDNLTYRLFVENNFFDLNNDTQATTGIIPIFASEVNKDIFSAENRSDTTKTYLVQSLNYLTLTDNVNNSSISGGSDPAPAATQTSSATFYATLVSDSWFSRTVSLESRVTVGFDRFLTLASRLSILWAQPLDLLVKLGRAPIQTEATPEFIRDTLKPLNYERLKTSFFDIPTVNFYISNITFGNNDIVSSFDLNAALTFVNGLSNSSNTIISTFNYVINPSSTTVKEFRALGQRDGNPDIDILDTINPINGSNLPANLFNFLPSYALRSLDANLFRPDVPRIIEFYNRFTVSSPGISATPIVYPNDEQGTLRIDYILNQVINGTNRFSFNFTNFKKTTDFFVGLKGKAIANEPNAFDFSTLEATPNDSEEQESTGPNYYNLDPYQLSTGKTLTNLFNESETFNNDINPATASELTKFYTTLNNSNLDLMGYHPQITNLSVQSEGSLLNALVNGTLSFQLTYPKDTITPSLARALGLDENLSRVFVYRNVPKLEDFYHFAFDRQRSEAVIQNYSSDIDITPEFRADVIDALVATGFNKDSAQFNLSWNNAVLDVEVIPQRNVFTDTLKVLPRNYNFQLSWVAKNRHQTLVIALSTSIPLFSVLATGVGGFIFYWNKKTNLRRFF
ncbi:hypothetical protein J2Z62_000032 [Mycoplasmoides fastidiosum]|uniref:Uncharacterized protein n=1 Tax=Mycoplasmoides fastidiosum TaxID=92758 RepID=A0ABU0LY20_9BACT|nr:hypothetical protein [Mycoplasmoides fastidiosum]MDQ0513594.1 hypothetical protein [Mycoplasmoides fastidiosum]UUD37983.1 hypothetical protein NPA10_01135 [Mycoplasmoides fastidiosum]